MTPSWIFADRAVDLPRAHDGIDTSYLADEAATVRALAARARLSPRDSAQVLKTARRLVTSVRDRRRQVSGLDAFMGQYDLSSQEGVALMCLAEALLRIPDTETADRLIADKLGIADFAGHLGTSESLFVNAATWGLMLTGRLVRTAEPDHEGLANAFGRAVGRLGEPVIRAALKQAMRILGQQFVMGRTIEEALGRAGSEEGGRYRYSFDMLGEAALTNADARRYLDAYAESIAAVGRSTQELLHEAAPSVSVKLSALYPRFEVAQSARAIEALGDRLLVLAKLAKSESIALTVDAEEADRLGLTLTIFENVFRARELGAWTGLGLAVQAYQKRALHVIEWLEHLAAGIGRTIPVRLVKGAYWDTEVKRAQEQGLSGYPVFTRKSSTDVSYLACARRLLEASPHLYAQLATHNAHTVAWVLRAAGDTAFEFQRLHGMGDALYAFLGEEREPVPCRVYAPVGSHEELLPYLVRRLLENGANTSFVNRIVDEDTSVDEIVEDPVALTDALEERLPHPRIPLPRDLFGAARRNSAGLNLADPDTLVPLAAELAAAAGEPHRAVPIVGGREAAGQRVEVCAPADCARLIGEAVLADAPTAQAALTAAANFFPQWSAVSARERATQLRKAADLIEANRAALMALCVMEAGRGIADSASEVREAVDFLRYYAHEGERLFGAPLQLPGPTGERNRLRLGGRGVFLCVSPWNFPISIFTGQIAAALVAGNTVLAKPAEQTSLVAARIVELLYAAGIPGDALHFLPGDGPKIGAAVLPDARLAGVVFTGSTETARLINKTLAAREGPLATLIAETGGVNAMIVDSSALPEQVVKDAVQSAFNSAGQRCSALRLLCLQEETAERILAMLEGSMAELVIGSPALLRTDVGPVIDADARHGLLAYIERHRAEVRYQRELPNGHESGLFVAPTLIELGRVADLAGEVFGPVLHVVRYRADQVDALVEAINALGYGLTLGVHSRIDSFAARIGERARVGNVYVNRNMIGAVVGVQPFGGMGLSGTGPKAGGPHYLARFATEQTVTVNTAAVGGNATLLSLE